MTKLNKELRRKLRKEFVNKVKEANGGPVEISDGRYYSIVKLNEDNILDMSEKFKKQLIEEGLYDNSYTSVIIYKKDELVDMYYLPIHGEPNRFVTKHFYKSMEEMLSADLRDRGFGLLEQYYEGKYCQNNECK